MAAMLTGCSTCAAPAGGVVAVLCNRASDRRWHRCLHACMHTCLASAGGRLVNALNVLSRKAIRSVM